MGSVEKQGIGKALPVGCGFRPRDDELIKDYLTRNEETSRVIPELNIYRWEPQALFEKYNAMSEYPSDGGECFFYCTRDAKNRMTQSGFWKETRKKRTLWGCEGEEIGSKRIFVYHKGRQPYGRKSTFSMHEYHLNCCTNPMIGADQGPATEFVLCRIINRKVKKIKPDSPSECLEADRFTPSCTAANQGDKDKDARGGFSPVCDPQSNLTEAEGGGHGDCSEMEFLQYCESIFNEHHIYNDHFDGPVNNRDDDPNDGVSISELWG